MLTADEFGLGSARLAPVAVAAGLTLGAIGAVAPLAAGTVVAIGPDLAALSVTAELAARLLTPLVAIVAAGSTAVRARSLDLLVAADRLALVTELVAAELGPELAPELAIAVHVELVAPAPRLRLLVLEPAALLAQHAKVMIRELQVIFGVDPIARALRVGGHVPILFVKLGGIAARAIVDAAAVALAALTRAAASATTIATTTAATAAGLTIVDQAVRPRALTKIGLKLPDAPRRSCSPELPGGAS